MIDPKSAIGIPVKKDGEIIGIVTDADFDGNDLKIQFSTGDSTMTGISFKNLKLIDSYSEGEKSQNGMVEIKL